MGLESVELVMAYEEEFNIRIPEKEAELMLTPRLAAEGIVKLLRLENRPIEREKIDESIKRLTIDILNLDKRIYHVDAKYVEDFGIG
ncbi:hypothetical protein [Pelagicoccus mobilis]|uniref:Uncharacterized protein n=1 Tax=Pelagicoccus mobilis TaxID=415221 RepID=A0A934S1M6_9BACT|nr:hypothetical protein [Pelagicoccus mobilis]MBK1880682.1 hypothetical protein [Pelagicoccus mobilis]